MNRNTFSNKIHKAFLLLLSAGVFGCGQNTDVYPQHRNIIDAVFASGHIENLYQYSVSANADGFLDKVLVVEGDTVQSGQLLFKLTNNVQKAQVYNAKTSLSYSEFNARAGSPQIEQLKYQIEQAQQKKSTDSINYVRYSHLVKSNAVSKSDEDNVRLQYISDAANLNVLEENMKDLYHNLKNNVDNAKAQLDQQEGNNDFYLLRAGNAGVVLSVNKKLGDLAKKGDLIAQIGSGISIAKLYIAEDDIHRVKLGQNVLISLNSDKYHPVKAVIKKIYPQFDNNDQSFVADAWFNNKTLQPVNGTQLQANIIIGEKSNALVIPSYFITSGDYVFVKGKADKVPVKTGISTLEYTEILSGLNDNDALLTPKQVK